MRLFRYFICLAGIAALSSLDAERVPPPVAPSSPVEMVKIAVVRDEYPPTFVQLVCTALELCSDQQSRSGSDPPGFNLNLARCESSKRRQNGALPDRMPWSMKGSL